MKYILFSLLVTIIFTLSNNFVFAQNISINNDGSKPDANAMLDVKAFNKGILIPRTSTASRTAIPNTKGLLVYDTTTNSFWYNNGASWQQISNGSSSLNGNVNYITKFTGTSSVGNSQIFDNGQYVGIGTITPKAGLNIIHNGGIIAKGDTLSANNYTLSETGAGSKFIWYPKRGALRAGFLDATYGFLWDDQYTGNWSTALGYDEFATGIGSFATGFQTSSQGSYSFSAGNNSMATRIATIAMGNNAKAEGDYSFAEGNGTTAVGVSSVAMGNATATQGDYSFALGNNTYSGGNYSFASGNSSHATAISSTAMGNTTTAGGNYSFAEGFGCQANGIGSVAMGYSNTAPGDFSFSAGSLSHANGSNSVAMGDNTTAGGSSAFSMGDFTNAGGNYSFAMGISATASAPLSIAMGSNITASGNNSMIFGQNLFDGGHKGNLMMGDTDPWNAGSVGSGTDDQMVCRFNNGYYFITGGNTNRTGIQANHGDNSWSQISDSTKKEKIIPVDGEQLLGKIAKFKLSTWNYKGQDPKVFRHYGPMAQDFHNAFGHDAFGTIGNDTLINQADFLGVSFTAIQALEKRTEKIEDQQKQIIDLQKQNGALSASNEILQQQLKSLISTVNVLNKKVEEIASAENKNYHAKIIAVNK
ncbi:MAG: tail fiber domain-containing protein [Ginsengibacter sp.]